eukprot:SM000107S14028  [mRNA]  locus=s107:68216:70046:- [translate_table: standard]
MKDVTEWEARTAARAREARSLADEVGRLERLCLSLVHAAAGSQASSISVASRGSDIGPTSSFSDAGSLLERPPSSSSTPVTSESLSLVRRRAGVRPVLDVIRQEHGEQQARRSRRAALVIAELERLQQASDSLCQAVSPMAESLSTKLASVAAVAGSSSSHLPPPADQEQAKDRSSTPPLASERSLTSRPADFLEAACSDDSVTATKRLHTEATSEVEQQLAEEPFPEADEGHLLDQGLISVSTPRAFNETAALPEAVVVLTDSPARQLRDSGVREPAITELTAILADQQRLLRAAQRRAGKSETALQELQGEHAKLRAELADLRIGQDNTDGWQAAPAAPFNGLALKAIPDDSLGAAQIGPQSMLPDGDSSIPAHTQVATEHMHAIDVLVHKLAEAEAARKVAEEQAHALHRQLEGLLASPVSRHHWAPYPSSLRFLAAAGVQLLLLLFVAWLVLLRELAPALFVVYPT